MLKSPISGSDAKRFLRFVSAAHAAGTASWTAEDVGVQRVIGGANNALYRIEANGTRLACKLCVADERQRAAREFGALRAAQSAGLDIAPQPLFLDETCSIAPFPAVIYRWLPGSDIKPPLTAPQLEALLDTLQRTHSVAPEDVDVRLLEAWFHWFDWEVYLADLNALLREYGNWLATTDTNGSALRDRLARVVNRCAETVRASDVNPGRESVPLCLVRVDPNLANAVWCDDGRLRWVDWEYSGWGDPALDLCELRWHAALATLPEEQHRWLRDNYRRPADDTAFEHRLAVWDSIIASRWPLLLLRRMWSFYNGPDRLRLTQMTADPAALRAQIGQFIQRAEQVIR